MGAFCILRAAQRHLDLALQSASRRRQALACPASFIFPYDVRRFYKFSDNIMLKNPYDADAHLCGQGRLCPQRIRTHNLPDFIER
jgi:hypothetical protein